VLASPILLNQKEKNPPRLRVEMGLLEKMFTGLKSSNTESR
jgi:hypothetical protein